MQFKAPTKCKMMFKSSPSYLTVQATRTLELTLLDHIPKQLKALLNAINCLINIKAAAC